MQAADALGRTTAGQQSSSSSIAVTLACAVYAVSYAGYGFGEGSSIHVLRYFAYALPLILLAPGVLLGGQRLHATAFFYLLAYLVLVGLSWLAGPGVTDPFWADTIATVLIISLFLPWVDVELRHARLVLILTSLLFVASYLVSDSKDFRFLHILTSATGAAFEQSFNNDAGGLVGPILAVFFHAVGAKLELLAALAISLLGGKRIAMIAIVAGIAAFYLATRLPALATTRRRFLALFVALCGVNFISCNLPAISDAAYHYLRPEAAIEQILLGRYAITAEMSRVIAERSLAEMLFGAGAGSARALATVVSDGTLTLPHNDWLKLLFDFGLVGSVVCTAFMAGIFCTSPVAFCLGIAVSIMMTTDNVSIYVYYQFLLALFVGYGAERENARRDEPAVGVPSASLPLGPATAARAGSALGLAAAVLAASALAAGQPVHAAGTAADIYVSTDGRDDWSGRLAAPNAAGSDGPVATLDTAIRRVATLRRTEPHRDRPLVVGLRGGTYYLAEPLLLTPQDSGSERSPTVFTAVGNERAVISGGTRISGWRTTPAGSWQAELPDVVSRGWSFAQLFVDDQRRFRPRLPARGYYRTVADIGRGQLAFARGDVRADWAGAEDVEVLAFHDWSATRRRIVSVNAEEGRAVLDGRAWTDLAAGSRFVVDNVRGALREPGQWYLDRAAGVLTYLPMAGETPERTQVVAPRLSHLVVLKGHPRQNRWVEHIVFRNLTFAHANWTLPLHGQSFPQAEIGLDAAIVTIGARNVLFDGIAVRHVGGYAIAFGAGSQANRLENCELVDLGAGGVKVGHAGPATWDSTMAFPDGPDMLVSGIVVRNCLIAHGGRLHPAGVGIWIGQSPSNVIEHNTIHDFYQTGISVGWTWGYGRSEAGGNDIGYNDIHDIGRGVLSDMGGIYTLGSQPGTRVHDNVVHHVVAHRYGAWGLYADEGSSNIVFERNLVHHTGSAGFFQHFGRNNTVRNNIIAFAADLQVEAARADAHGRLEFTHNIVYWDGSGSLIGGCFTADDPCPISFVLDHNVYWNRGGTTTVFPGRMDLGQWRGRYGQDAHSLVADPRFANAEIGDFRLEPGSPATAIDFDPLDPGRAGRTAPACLTASLPPVPPGFD